jgi:hypothetical protein
MMNCARFLQRFGPIPRLQFREKESLEHLKTRRRNDDRRTSFDFHFIDGRAVELQRRWRRVVFDEKLDALVGQARFRECPAPRLQIRGRIFSPCDGRYQGGRRRLHLCELGDEIVPHRVRAAIRSLLSRGRPGGRKRKGDCSTRRDHREKR